jgi:hypothetical protein
MSTEDVIARQNAYCGIVSVVVRAPAERALFRLVRVIVVGRYDSFAQEALTRDVNDRVEHDDT